MHGFGLSICSCIVIGRACMQLELFISSLLGSASKQDSDSWSGRSTRRSRDNGKRKANEWWKGSESDSIWTCMVPFLPSYITNRVYGRLQAYCSRAVRDLQLAAVATNGRRCLDGSATSCATAWRVDRVRERRGCAQAVYGCGGTQAEARAVGVCIGQHLCKQQGALGEGGRMRRRHVVHVCEGLFDDMWQQTDDVDGSQI